MPPVEHVYSSIDKVIVSKLPGDPWALRGIPAVSRDAASGAIAETQPGWNLDEWAPPSKGFRKPADTG